MALSDTTNGMANLLLADLDDNAPVHRTTVAPPSNAAPPQEFLVVGRLVTEKPFRFMFLRDTMASVWRPAMGLNGRELQSRRFLFRFFHEVDVKRIIEDSPWSYDQNLLILRRIEQGIDPETVDLSKTEFWVQVHGLPTGFRSDGVLEALGNFMGGFIRTDERNFDGSLRLFFRIRVLIDVTKPLRKGMRLRKEDGGWITVDFRYERLPTFCFYCGIIGHGDRFCPATLTTNPLPLEKPYGAWLRAGGRRQQPTAGLRWIAPESTVERETWEAPGISALHKNLIPSDTAIQITPISEGVISSEQKRRRKEVELSLAPMDTEVIPSKNLSMAGTGGSQARPSQ